MRMILAASLVALPQLAFAAIGTHVHTIQTDATFTC